MCLCKIPPAGEHHYYHHQSKEFDLQVTQDSGIISCSRSSSSNQSFQVEEINGPSRDWVQWCSACRGRREVGVASSSGSLPPSAPGPGAAVVGCLVGVYPCSQTSAGPRGPTTATHLIQGIPTTQQLQGTSCRACCCSHINNHHHQQQPPTAVQLTSQRGGLSLRVARVASTTSVRAAPYAHPQHQGLGPECR